MMSRAKKRLVGAVLPSPGEYQAQLATMHLAALAAGCSGRERQGDTAFGSTLPAAAVAQF